MSGALRITSFCAVKGLLLAVSADPTVAAGLAPRWCVDPVLRTSFPTGRLPLLLFRPTVGVGIVLCTRGIAAVPDSALGHAPRSAVPRRSGWPMPSPPAHPVRFAKIAAGE